MQMYSIRYENIQRRFEASSHLAARILGTRWLASRVFDFDPDKVAVIDVDAAGWGTEPEYPTEAERIAARWILKNQKLADLFQAEQVDVKKVTAEWLLTREGDGLPGRGRSATFDGEAGTYSDPRCYACPGETTWARIQQEELDKVHAIWSRRSGDKSK